MASVSACYNLMSVHNQQANQISERLAESHLCVDHCNNATISRNLHSSYSRSSSAGFISILQVRAVS
jgi:hypothetical protein